MRARFHLFNNSCQDGCAIGGGKNVARIVVAKDITNRVRSLTAQISPQRIRSVAKFINRAQNSLPNLRGGGSRPIIDYIGNYARRNPSELGDIAMGWALFWRHEYLLLNLGGQFAHASVTP